MTQNLISIEALVILDAIEYRGSYAAAAEQLNKVPSALSYVVQKLEEQLQVTLFQRQGRRAVLTPAGKHLLAEGREILYAINALSEQTQTIANGWEPRIRIACDAIIDIQSVLQQINQFLTEHQNVEIDIQEQVISGTWEVLIEDKVDLVIGAPGPVPNQKGIRAVKLTELANVLVAHKSHPLTSINKTMQPSELSCYRSIIVHDSAKNEILWSANIIEGSQHFFVSSVSQKVAAISAGIGIGYLPKYLIQNQLSSGELVIIELTEPRPTEDLYRAWKLTNKGKGLKRLTSLLLDKAAKPTYTLF